jgi:hypothetical protein
MQPHCRPSLPPAEVPTRRLVAVPPGSALRAEVEAFIQRVFADKFGAQVQQFAPQLVALLDDTGRVRAAAGWRDAAEQPLFLERYLNAPVHTLLGQASRAGIVEVGHLAADGAGDGRRLILLLGPHLAAQGARWVVSTLTEELRHLFVRLGIAPLALGTADPTLLGDAAASWGRYYDHRPVVLAGQVDTALAALRRRGVLS